MLKNIAHIPNLEKYILVVLIVVSSGIQVVRVNRFEASLSTLVHIHAARATELLVKSRDTYSVTWFSNVRKNNTETCFTSYTIVISFKSVGMCWKL